MSTAATTTERRDRFRALHTTGLFVMPNPWDVGSARLLAGLGFAALATTSSGHGASLGRDDQQVARDELLAHAAALAAAVDVPVSVDAERCFAADPAGVAETVRLLAGTGAAGCSIEDYDPATGRLDDPGPAVERVGAAAEAAHAAGMVLTARAERHLYAGSDRTGSDHAEPDVPRDDLDDTVDRLRAFRAAGADVLYAPGLRSAGDIGRLVAGVGAPVNVLALPGAPAVAELAALGVRRVSTGGALARTAYAAAAAAARALGPVRVDGAR